MPTPSLRPGSEPIAEVIAASAHGRLGLTTRVDLRRAGLSDDEIDGALESGMVVPMHQGTFRVGGVALSRRRLLLGACLASGEGAVASHRAALWLWQLTDRVPPTEITVPYGKHPLLDGVVVHRSTDLRDAHVIIRRGVPVTRPARTLVDAGAVLPVIQVEHAVELALLRRLVTVRGLRTMIDEVGGRGRRGVAALRSVLDERALGERRPESMLEPLMARLLREHGVGPIDYQPEIVLEGRVLRPDFGIARAMLVVEVDGLAVHGTRTALDHDLERQNLFTRHGYLVLRYTSTHLRRPALVASEILTTARRRVAALDATRSLTPAPS